MDIKNYILKIALNIAIIFVSNLIGQNENTINHSDLTAEKTQPSSGSYMLHQKLITDIPSSQFNGNNLLNSSSGIEAIGTSFEGFNYDDNGTETGGYRFIPPDPIGAAGTDQLIAVVNVMIEARDKSGTLLWRDALKDFFSSTGGIGTLNTYTFDPKVVFDHYENRFVVVTLEQTDTYYGDPSNESRILLAVSKTATPATATSSDWWFYAIDSKVNISGTDCWADYPGFEIDEEAIYITNNMFQFRSLGGANSGVRLWIVDKGVSSGFYSGGTVSWNIYNPYSGGGTSTTTMPALVYGSGGAGSGIGTYLVSYSGLSGGGLEYIQVVRVNNPLGSVSFTQTYVNIGDIENTSTSMPDAPQSGSSYLIETNDRRALDAVWRNDYIWLATTIVPSSGDDAGEATAHWVKLNTTSWPATLDDQGNIGGEDIDASGDVYTFFPSVAVNDAGDAYFGFAASSANIYGGAYCAGRMSGDASGTIRASETVWAGVGPYKRYFGGTRNRWGDYSGTSLDPVDDNLFWIFNEFADEPGSTGSGTYGSEDGRWGTAWGSFSFVQTEFTNGGNGAINFSQSSPSPPESDWPFGKFTLNSSDADAILNRVVVAVSGSYSGLDGAFPFRLKASDTNDYSTASAIGSDTSESGGSITFSGLNDALPSGLRYYWVTADLSGSATGTINGTISNSDSLSLSGGSISTASNFGQLNTGPDISLPVLLSTFTAQYIGKNVELNWSTQSEIENLGFVVERSPQETNEYIEISSYKYNSELRGQGNTASATHYHFVDQNIQAGKTYSYKIADISINGLKNYHGPIYVKVPAIPSKFKLFANYPNPFNMETNIKIQIPNDFEDDSNVTLNIFNNLGQLVRKLYRGKISEGIFKIKWDGKNDQGEYLPSGTFYLIFNSEYKSQIQKMVLVK